MGYSNPPVPWKEMEATLSGRARPFPSQGDGSDSPAWSYKRPAYRRRADFSFERGEGASRARYAELHCHSNFSFLDGASHPEELAEEAARLGLTALALTDHDGMYGVVRFAEAAREVGLATVFGVELSIGLTRSQAGVPDPEGTHLVVLARDPLGYTRLCRAVSVAHMRGMQKGRPTLDIETLSALGAGGLPDFTSDGIPVGEPSGLSGEHWLVLTGCRKGSLTKALMEHGPSRAAGELQRLQSFFGKDNVVVELWDHGDPLDSARNDALVDVAVRSGADLVATNNVHYHRRSRQRIAGALAAVRARRSLDDMDGWLPGAAFAYLRSGEDQERRFARYPGVVERAAELGAQCAFDLNLLAPKLPPWPAPEGHSEMSWLRHLAEEGAAHRYGSRQHPRHPKAWGQIDYELEMIEQLGFAGYFLIVWDVVEFCRTRDIFCQGRGSAANSAVCYSLGITKADAVGLGLLFERFLSPERDGPPDIDIDIESGRREEVIQYLYRRYGRGAAAQVANVITYRPRSAVRDMGRALGASTGQLDAWSKQVDAWGPLESTVEHQIPAQVMDLAGQLQHFPRHLGIHSGGMVICDRPVSEVCPVEWARMPGRSVLQWDKDDCAATGLVKFDLLGLGMLSVLHSSVDHVKEFYGLELDLAELPQDDEVYDMLCRADSVGVFQVESRAQMATLPRLAPRCFYDLVVEVALIRPGPIQGGSVHPYIRRRNGTEAVTYLHPLLEKSLAKTLGIPLFQEQLMQMAIDVAGFSGAESDQLRQAMGSKRSLDKMQRIRARLYEGMGERGITGGVADAIWDKMVAFANYGFPESHSVSFAYLVYSSAWLKCHYPAAFCAGLLDGQPMGFWSPQTIVSDARRHCVEVLRPDVNLSRSASVLEACSSSGKGTAAVRMGLTYVRGMGKEAAERVVGGQPYLDMEDFLRRSGLDRARAEALATAGAFDSFGVSRRSALWGAGAISPVGTSRNGTASLDGLIHGVVAPPLPGMTPVETNSADLWSTGLSTDSYPTQFLRSALEAAGVLTAANLAGARAGEKVTVAGVVTHRQRPATAQGVTFINLEDETGLINVVCSAGAWARYRKVARSSPALLVRGRLERADSVTNVIAERIEAISFASSVLPTSRDFR